jgi:hypothetical protein
MPCQLTLLTHLHTNHRNEIMSKNEENKEGPAHEVDPSEIIQNSNTLITANSDTNTTV